MLANRLSCYFFSKTLSSLKLLQLTPPTSKKAIKTKYYQLAKKLHPDTSTEDGKQKSEKQQKDEHQAFIQVTQAYKYLSQLTQEQINNPEKEDQTSGEDSRQEHHQEGATYRPRTQEERMRMATEAYFNKRYQKPKESSAFRKEPLYKQVPQLFVGFFCVLGFVIEWFVYAYKKTKLTKLQNPGDPNDETFKKMNFKKRYHRSQNLEKGIERDN